MNNYIFKSKQLGFRNWIATDLAKMQEINSDKEVMAFFPTTRTLEQTKQFIEKMQNQLKTRGFCYFAVDKLETGKLIGFIGISEQRFKSDFTPCIDIGWRLDKKEWRKGYATEGAKRCLEYGFQDLKLDEIFAIAPLVNVPSIQVMKKIGMTLVKIFDHPLLMNEERLRNCALYQIRNGAVGS